MNKSTKIMIVGVLFLATSIIMTVLSIIDKGHLSLSAVPLFCLGLIILAFMESVSFKEHVANEVASVLKEMRGNINV